MWSESLWLKVIVYIGLFFLTFGEVTFFNLECTSHDKSYGDFEFCYIKAINRSLKYASGKFNVRQNLTQATVAFTIFKRENGWKPFLYNVSTDACKLLKSANKNPVINHIFNTFKNYSNLNHTCPYNHDIAVINVPTTAVNSFWNKALPMPSGDYCLHTKIFIKRKLSVEIRFYVRTF